MENVTIPACCGVPAVNPADPDDVGTEYWFRIEPDPDAPTSASSAWRAKCNTCGRVLRRWHEQDAEAS